jgi:hypothetical protein
MAFSVRSSGVHRRNRVVTAYGADQEAVLFQPPMPQHDMRQAEQASRERYARAERNAARNAELGIQKPRMRESIRHWFRWLTRRKPADA